MDTTTALLHSNCDKLLEQYKANLDAVLDLQARFTEDILPAFEDETQSSTDTVEWAKEWLADTFSIFKLYRYHKFTKAFAIEAMRKNLLWRIEVLWPIIRQPPPPSSSIGRCLPTAIRDPFGRPILLIECSQLVRPSEEVKTALLLTAELMRLHLARFKREETSSDGAQPPLQYILILDLHAVTLTALDIDLFSWLYRELLPHFPGTLAAVFITNYSWSHAGLRAMVKPLLSQAAVARLIFASNKELVRYFTSEKLPRDYGGILPSIKELEDPLRFLQLPTSADSSGRPVSAPIAACAPTVPSSPARMTNRPPPSAISPTSLLNPFFGYPVVHADGTSRSAVPVLRHGRRRKRDLVRTLIGLWWAQHRSDVRLSFILLTLWLVLVFWGRRRVRWPRDAGQWSSLPALFLGY